MLKNQAKLVNNNNDGWKKYVERSIMLEEKKEKQIFDKDEQIEKSEGDKANDNNNSFIYENVNAVSNLLDKSTDKHNDKKEGRKISGNLQKNKNFVEHNELPFNAPKAVRATRRFRDLSAILCPWTIKFAEEKFHYLTPIQDATIPLLLEKKKDVLVQACTGSGKTLAYLIPLVEIILKNFEKKAKNNSIPNDSKADDNSADFANERSCLNMHYLYSLNSFFWESQNALKAKAKNEKFNRKIVEAGEEEEEESLNSREKCKLAALVLLPTRELAIQVFDILQEYIAFLRTSWNRVVDKDIKENEEEKENKTEEENLFAIRSILLRGGCSYESDKNKIITLADKKALNIFVGTPGRVSFILSEAIQSKLVDLVNSFQLLILDEADRLLDFQFSKHVDNILSIIPKQRQSGLFSATLSHNENFKKICNSAIRNAAYITLECTSNSIQSYLNAASKNEEEEEYCIKKSIKESDNLDNTQNKKHEGLSNLHSSFDTPHCLQNFYFQIRYDYKIAFLLKFLLGVVIPRGLKCIIFFLTCSSVDYFHRIICELLSDTNANQSHLFFMNEKNEKIHLRKRINKKDNNFSIVKECNDNSNETQKINNNKSLAVERKIQKKKAKNIYFTSPLLPIFKLHSNMSQTARNKTYVNFSKRVNHVSSEVDVSNFSVLLSTDVAARGVDFPCVDWTIQFDCPQREELFVHRIGRAGRAGREGYSFIFVNEDENAYIPYLMKQNIVINDFENTIWFSEVCNVKIKAKKPGESLIKNKDEVSDEIFKMKEDTKEKEKEDKENHFCAAVSETERNDVLNAAKKFCIQDREILLKSIKAFVSFVRAYAEHQLSFIFSFKKLDLGFLATSFSLLRIPRISEILGKKIKNFVQSDVDPSSIPFKNKKMEKERKLKLEEERKRMELMQLEKRKRLEKLEKENKKKSRSRSEKRKTKIRSKYEEWDELALEERLAKKLRKGLISVEDYEQKLRGFESNDSAKSETEEKEINEKMSNDALRESLLSCSEDLSLDENSQKVSKENTIKNKRKHHQIPNWIRRRKKSKKKKK